jgi:hypothetical protein
MTYHQLCNLINNTTGATGGAGTAYPSGAPVFTPRVLVVILLIVLIPSSLK